MYRDTVDWSTSKMSAHTSSMMFCRRYPHVTTSASRSDSSRGRPSPLSHGRSSNIVTRHSSSPSCSSSSPDIRSNRNGFSTSEVWLVTSFVSTGEAVASHLGRRVAYVPESLGEQLVGLLRTGFCIILQDLTISGSGTDFTVNGSSSIVCGNVQTENATVYIVDSVLMPKS